MSVSTLESLPNEILTNILEKYINGLDIINAFAFQLNSRFDALIAGCQRFRFDFIRCHKNDFSVCIGLLPSYINKIEELSLSEQNTPGQIHAFLSFFPSFDLFKRLRKLYFHINTSAVQPDVLTIAFHSLVTAPLHTLCIEIIKAKMIPSLNDTIVEIFRMKTLKKLSLICDSYKMKWTALSNSSSNIECLTMYGIFCEFQDLEHIFRCVSDLKYLDVQLERDSRNYELESSSEDVIPRMSMLHTVLFKIERYCGISPSTLESYLRCMPSLHRLEITGHRNLYNMKDWEILLKISAPMLTHFHLESSVGDLESSRHNKLFESIQTPFWIEKKNFNIIIKQSTNDPIDRWWRLRPLRKLKDNLSTTNKISSLILSAESNYLLQNYYLNNVKHLVVEEFNDNLFELITTHVNCSQIRHLDVKYLNIDMDSISSFLPYISNIASLRIRFNYLFDDRLISLKKCNNLKFLDISASQHDFDDKHIFQIASICPNIEHLTIDTRDLQNIPMLQTYLPRLRSLCFAHTDRFHRYSYDNYEERIAHEEIRQKSQFLFQRGSYRTMVWIDEVALQDFYWQNTNSNSEQYSDD